MPRNPRQRSQSRRDHQRAPRLLEASQLSPHIWLTPSAGLRIWSQSTGEGLRSPAAGPSERPACGRRRSLRPFPPLADQPVTQPGLGARAPGGPGGPRREAQPRDPTQALRPRPAPARARLCGVLSVCPGSEEVLTGTAQRGKSAPALPASSAPCLAPRGSRFLPPFPLPQQGETFLGGVFSPRL